MTATGGPRVRLELRLGGYLVARPAAFLGGALFDHFRAACARGGARFSPVAQAIVAPLAAGRALVAVLEAAGFRADFEPALIAALGAAEAAKIAHVEEAATVAAGKSLYPFQVVGAKRLAAGDLLLADQMGCVSGKAIVRVNRAGKGFALALAELHARFHGAAPPSGNPWDLTIPTRIRALVGEDLRLHDVVDVLDRGVRPVVRVVLADGTALALTPDHEVALAGGLWRAAGELTPGTQVLRNGTPACGRCGTTRDVVTRSYARFRGYCRLCITRVLRHHPRRVDGRFVDNHGYVRVTGRWDHPRAWRCGQVYEHLLVAEAHLGRPVRRDEVVHHRNGIRHDNRPENLQVLPSRSEHGRRHGLEGGYRHLDGGRSSNGGLVCFVPKLVPVARVESAGEEHVYDVVCADPHRNFVADGIVVHNCGKTIQVLAALPKSARALVVCPAVVKGVWVDETTAWRPDLAPVLLAGRGSFRWPQPGEVAVTNYDVLPDEALPAPAGVVVVLDEAHAVKSPRAARTKRARALARAVRDAGGRTWLLTGTPLLNRPDELWHVLAAAGLEHRAFGDWPRFLRLFRARKRHFGGYDWGGPLPEVPALLAPVMLRRTREEVLPELPSWTSRDVPVEIPATTRALLDDVLVKLGGEARLRAAIEQALATRSGVEFTELSRARAALATAKTPAALRLVEDLEEQEEPVVAFSAHVAPVEALAAREGWRAIMGATPERARAEAVELFQAGRLRGLAVSIAAGGLGITLTRGARALFVDEAWTPAANAQARDRLVRIGQRRGVVVERLVADHAIDKHVARLLAEKLALFDAVVAPATDLLEEARTKGVGVGSLPRGVPGREQREIEWDRHEAQEARDLARGRLT